MGIGKTYRIDYIVSKKFNTKAPHPKALVGQLTGELVSSLDQVYIVLIVVTAVIIVSAPIAAFFIVKKRKKVIYVK